MPDSFQSSYNLKALRHTAALWHDEDDGDFQFTNDGRVFLLADFLADDGDLILQELDFVKC